MQQKIDEFKKEVTEEELFEFRKELQKTIELLKEANAVLKDELRNEII